MSTQSNSVSEEQVPVPVDALALWASESAAGSAPAPLALVKLNASDKILIPFCARVERTTVHYVEDETVRSYVHCAGADCPMCRIGQQVETRDLVPVYDPMTRAVGVLAVSPSQRPSALRPQLMPVLQRVANNECLMIVVKRLDMQRFEVKSGAIRDGADDGAAAIKRFLADYVAGRVRMADVYLRLSPADLAAVPTVARLLKFQGAGA